MGGLFAPSKQTSTSRVELPAWANAGLEQTSQRALGLMERPFQGYGGERVAGMSDWTGAGAGAVAGAAGYQPGTVTAANVTPGQVTPGMLAGRDLSAYYDPFQREVIDAAMADIDRGTRVAQAGRAAGGVQAAGFGGFGDRAAVAGAEIERAGLDAKARAAAGLRSQGFQRAQDMAVADINRDLSGQTFNAQTGQQAQLANQQAGLGAQQFNVSSGMQGAELRNRAGMGLAGLGEVERGVRQQGLDVGYQDFREARDDPFLKTQWAAGVIGGNAGPYAGNVTQTTPGPSLFSQLLGAGTSAAAMYSLLSDPQDKTDKRRLGTDPATGLGIWAYRYKGDSKRNPKVVGVMADEVAERFPHLVREVNGHRVVDMAGLAALSEGLGAVPGYAGGGVAGPDERALWDAIGADLDAGGMGVDDAPYEPALWDAIGADLDAGGMGVDDAPLVSTYRGALGSRSRRMVRDYWDAQPSRPDLPPLIEGVAEPVPVTDAWQGTPLVPGMGARGPVFGGEAPVPLPAPERGAVGEGIGPEMAPPGEPVFAGEGAAGGATPAMPPAVRAALARLRPGRRGGAGPAFPGETPAALPGVAPAGAPRAGAPAPAIAAPSPAAMPDAMPAGDAPVVPAGLAMPGPGPAAMSAGDDRGWLRRFADRLVDPEYAGQVALLQAGLGMMASRNPNWAGAIGEGALAGLASAERARPLVQRRRQQQQFQDWLRNLPDPAAVSPPIPPRPGAAPAAAPARMASVAVPSLADRVAQAESGGDPAARNPAPGSTAGGVMQITDALWSDYAPRLGLGADQRMDAGAQRRVFEAFEVDMRRDLPRVLGRAPTDQDIYAAWGLGPAGFRALASADPGADALEVYGRAAGPERARQAFAQNGRLMRPGMTAGEVLEAWRGRLPAGGATPAGDAAAPPPAPAQAREPGAAGAEPTIQIGGRSLTRSQVLSMAAAMPDNEAVQNFVRMALPMLNQEAARREAAADRALARQENADLRREIAGARREPMPTNLSRLMAERDALPPGDPRRGAYDAAIRRESGEAASERFTPAQVAQLRRDAFTAARTEANGLDFDSEADRTGWINQRARDLLGEWGATEVLGGAPRGGGFAVAPLGGQGAGRPSGQPDDAAADSGARIRPRGPVRMLPDSARRELGRLGEAAQVMPTLLRDWQDDFGGFGSETLGDFANWVARRTPGESPRADWWARYQEQVNLIRNALFGSALTRTETEQFNKASINPGMSAEAIRSRLREQAAAAQRAAMRLAQSYAASGYNRREIEAALGMEIPREAPRPGEGAVSGGARRGDPGQRDAPPPARDGGGLDRFMPSGGR